MRPFTGKAQLLKRCTWSESRGSAVDHRIMAAARKLQDASSRTGYVRR